MLNIEEILKISNEMGIEVRDGTENTHYIANSDGKYIEFDTSMLMSANKDNVLGESNLQVSDQFSVVITSSIYKLSSCDTTYTSTPVSVTDSITDAA